MYEVLGNFVNNELFHGLPPHDFARAWANGGRDPGTVLRLPLADIPIGIWNQALRYYNYICELIEHERGREALI